MKKVYIVAAKRSAIGAFSGSLSALHPSVFSSTVLKAVLNEGNIPSRKIDEVVIGNVLPAGNGQGLARQISIKSGIPSDVPAYSINMVCGSGMKSVMTAYGNIKAGLQKLVVAGGVESMSRAPFLLPADVRSGFKMGDLKLVDHMINDALIDAFNNYHMGITAENVADKYNLTRGDLDEFAILSQEKALKASDAGAFSSEIVPIVISTRKGDIVFDKDEYINRTTSLDKLLGLRPTFKKDGIVTAGNSSGLNDGASFCVVASEKAVEKYNLHPLVEIVAVGQGGVDPSVMGLGPVPAIKNALKSAKLELKDIDVIELNEAFAAQSLGVVKELARRYDETVSSIMARTNINGGAIALGHPVGCSGNRVIVTLIHELLKNEKATYGLASLCIGGGMGTAVILKKVK